MNVPDNHLFESATKGDIDKFPFVAFTASKADFDRLSKSIDAVHTKSKKSGAPDDLLAKVFFHPMNITTIQKDLMTAVLNKTKGRYSIGPQNRSDIRIVMDAIYDMYAKNRPDNVREQATHLNKLVVDQVLPSIMTEIRASIKYEHDISNPHHVMDVPVYVSIKGENLNRSYLQ
jgi:hypothetical protein